MNQKDLDEVDELINTSKVLNLKTRPKILRFINKRIPVDTDNLEWRRVYYLRYMFVHVGIHTHPYDLRGVKLSKNKVLNL